jgi:hypothetical protein
MSADFVASRAGRILGLLGVAFVAIRCGGPEAIHSKPPSGSAGQTGSAGATAGATGTAGAGGDTGAAGSGGDVGGAGATGTAGTTGAAGATGGAGATGTAGTTGNAGAGGATGTAGGGGSGGKGGMGGGGAGSGGGKGGTGGAAGTGGTGGAPCNCKLAVEYECRQNGANVLAAEFSIKVHNTGTTPIQLNTVNVRYWYTLDGTGAQAGTCASAAHPCTIAFQSATPAKPTADEYAVISFASGTLAPDADTGEIQIVVHGTGMFGQANDYSFYNSGSTFYERMQLTGYVSGKLLWGIAP